MTTTTKTPAEIEALKEDWLGDPCWDLELAEGFEAHHDELLAYRMATQGRWDRGRLARLGEKALSLGCRGNLKLAEYVERLESRIEALERRLDQS